MLRSSSATVPEENQIQSGIPSIPLNVRVEAKSKRTILPLSSTICMKNIDLFIKILQEK